jgi:hypothetical protein
MPTYNRDEWLAGIQQIGSISNALKRDKRVKEDEFVINGELDDDAREYYSSIAAIFERNVKEGTKNIIINKNCIIQFIIINYCIELVNKEQFNLENRRIITIE